SKIPPGEPGPDVISRLKWPNTPYEGRIPDNSGKTAMHTATCTVTRPRGLVMYHAIINWQDHGVDPKARLGGIRQAHEKGANDCQERAGGRKNPPGGESSTESSTERG